MQKPEHDPYDSSCLRWVIPSKSEDGADYLVQIEPPSCQCRWWVCEVGPKLERGLKPRQLCSHYEEADKRFKECAKWIFSEMDKNKKQNETT